MKPFISKLIVTIYDNLVSIPLQSITADIFASFSLESQRLRDVLNSQEAMC